MGEEELRSACETEGIALPESQEAPLLLRAMRSRLRQALRWQHLDTEQLRKACELRHFDFIGKDRSQLLQQLRSFKVIPQPKSSPKVEPRRASAKSSASRRAAPSPEEDIQDGTGDYPSWMSERLRKACAKYPNFSGNFVQEMEEWSVQDVEMYLYSNGFLRPKKATARRSVPRAVLRAHYQLLGLEEGANATEIRKAYRRLALIYHPDKNPEDPDAAAETFRRLAEAYEVLTANLNVEDVRPPSAPCPRSVSSSRRKESLHEVEPCFGGLASERIEAMPSTPRARPPVQEVAWLRQMLREHRQAQLATPVPRRRSLQRPMYPIWKPPSEPPSRSPRSELSHGWDNRTSQMWPFQFQENLDELRRPETDAQTQTSPPPKLQETMVDALMHRHRIDTTIQSSIESAAVPNPQHDVEPAIARHVLPPPSTQILREPSQLASTFQNPSLQNNMEPAMARHTSPKLASTAAQHQSPQPSPLPALLPDALQHLGCYAYGACYGKTCFSAAESSTIE
eukprot:symbB.v1.2.023684.t2/scaffold2172.1/size87052/3